MRQRALTLHEQELLEERAGIIEHQGNQPRPEAERLALVDLERQQAQFQCSCGTVFPDILGRYGCPNCHGDGHVQKLFC